MNKTLFPLLLVAVITAGQVFAAPMTVGKTSTIGPEGIDYVAPTISYIQDPVFGMPAFWIRGGGNDAMVVFDPTANGLYEQGTDYSNWRVYLEKSNGASFEVEIPVDIVEYQRPYYYLHVYVPEWLPEDLFDVVVNVESQDELITDMQPNAVKVIDHIKDTFNFVHITDVHFDDPRGLAGNFTETINHKFIRKMISVVNILNPDFVIFTGDLVFGDSYSFEYPDAYEELQTLDVPIFMSIGNHDAINHKWPLGVEKVDGLKTFENCFAPLDFTFRYGDFEYISTSSMDWTPYDRIGIGVATINWQGQYRTPQLDWIESQLAESDAQLVVVGLHHPPSNSFTGTGADEFEQMMIDYNVNAVLTGHTHWDDVRWDGDVQYITTESVLFNWNMDNYPGFRLIRVADNSIVSYNYEEPYWSYPVYKDSYPGCRKNKLHTPSIECSFDPANDGTNPTVTATISNHMHDNFFNAGIEFLVPEPESGMTYEVDGGEVTDVLDTSELQIWYVNVELDQESTIQVTINPVSEE